MSTPSLRIPLINNILPIPTYNGVQVKPGTTDAHQASRPILTKIGAKKILCVCIGASTPGQISTAIERLGGAMVDFQIINCCVGSEDINKWLVRDGDGWTNVETELNNINRPLSDVQMVIMCHDDLRDQSLDFSAALALANLMENFVVMMKGGDCFPNLKHVELFTRYNADKVTDPKFAVPTDYHNSFACKFLVESCIRQGGRIMNVFISDKCGHLYTQGETVRSDGFQMFFSWFKGKGTKIHLDVTKQGDDITAQSIVDNMKAAYQEFK